MFDNAHGFNIDRSMFNDTRGGHMHFDHRNQARHVAGSGNTNTTTYDNCFNDNSRKTSHHHDRRAYHGTVNNIGSVGAMNTGDNHGYMVINSPRGGYGTGYSERSQLPPGPPYSYDYPPYGHQPNGPAPGPYQRRTETRYTSTPSPEPEDEYEYSAPPPSRETRSPPLQSNNPFRNMTGSFQGNSPSSRPDMQSAPASYSREPRPAEPPQATRAHTMPAEYHTGGTQHRQRQPEMRRTYEHDDHRCDGADGARYSQEIRQGQHEVRQTYEPDNGRDGAHGARYIQQIQQEIAHGSGHDRSQESLPAMMGGMNLNDDGPRREPAPAQPTTVHTDWRSPQPNAPSLQSSRSSSDEDDPGEGHVEDVDFVTRSSKGKTRMKMKQVWAKIW